MHTRCYKIPDDQPVPDAFTCDSCAAAGPHAQHAHAEQHAHVEQHPPAEQQAQP